jgi:hypothetical protein
MTFGHEPIDPAIDPDIELVRPDDCDRRLDNFVLKDALFDDTEIRPDEKAAVERGDGRGESERFDEHLHSARGPTARDREGDVCSRQRLHARQGARREHFLSCDERAIDIGEKKLYRHNVASNALLAVQTPILS